MFTLGTRLILKGLYFIVTSIFFLPLPLLPTVLNFLLQEFADSMHYTKQDVYKHPVTYSCLGWLFIYIIFAALLPIFAGSAVFNYGTGILGTTAIFGGMIWIVALVYFIIYIPEISKWFIKTLTRVVSKI